MGAALPLTRRLAGPLQGAVLADPVAADARAQYQAPAGKVIEGGGLAGQFPGPAAREWCDQDARPNPPGQRGHGRQQDPWVGDRLWPRRQVLPPYSTRANGLPGEGGMRDGLPTHKLRYARTRA